ncbi:uncharacterized protein [Solanum tuberosum]|uniref:uncharacterized protein isoform X3 n=1 Tax=Solanum tuberosum TaxID=4113 RepID=UPI00073A3C7B|nr:PREDICTED: uncharacterized protein LOC102578834 isoform X3 [Solanum tuberosum]
METVENRTRMREEVGPRKKMWGTWEELILGGAILRHGIQDWNIVALELRSRNIYFTPQACKAKYEDLQKRYAGCNAWFEELRKRRVEELKRELVKSESSIGSLVTKIESLKAEKERSSQINYGSGTHTKSPAAHESECMESIGKDGLCAGNFMLDSTRTNFSPEFESPAVASANEINSKLECSESCEAAEVPNISNQAETTNGNGRRALRKRKRKDVGSDVKRSIGESDNVCSISGISLSNCKETSTSCDQSIKPTATEDNKEGLSRLMNDDLMAIFNSIIQNEAAMVFRHHCDSQKRAKYKEMIKQHMDIETVRSRLVSCSIKSPGNLPVKPRSARPRPSKSKLQSNS